MKLMEIEWTQTYLVQDQAGNIFSCLAIGFYLRDTYCTRADLFSNNRAILIILIL